MSETIAEIKHVFKRAWNWLDSCLFPSHCARCGAEGPVFCGLCIAEIQFARQICFVCRKESENGFTHQACRLAIQSPAPCRFLSACEYASIAKLIHAFKYEQIAEAGKICAKILAEFACRVNPPINFPKYQITFVPMHSRRQNVRGFNQSQILANTIAAEFGASTVPLLSKIANTPAQAELNKDQRAANLAKSPFACLEHAQRKTIFVPKKKTEKMAREMSQPMPEKIILIDDVFTTGSTMKACCAQLFSAGAREIICLTLARD